jgi:hypothetical protein
MTDYEKLREDLKEFCKAPIQVSPAKVIAVDQANYTVDVTFPTGFELPEVRLKTSVDGNKNGFVLIPEVGTNVLVSLIGNIKDECFVVSFDKIAKVLFVGNDKMVVSFDAEGNVIFNEGMLGGIVKIEQLISRLNAIEQKVNDLILACKSQVVTLAPAGTFPMASFFTSVTNLESSQRSDLENEKLKH